MITMGENVSKRLRGCAVNDDDSYDNNFMLVLTFTASAIIFSPPRPPLSVSLSIRG